MKPTDAKARTPDQEGGHRLLLGELDVHLMAEGRHWQLADCLGAQAMMVDGVEGVRFAVWAPNARKVSVVGDFNDWDGRRDPMFLRRECGVWECFVPGVGAGALYKYELQAPNGDMLALKADPMARQSELPPATASVVAEPEAFHWTDEAWMAERGRHHRIDAPISIYEAHLDSWARDAAPGRVWKETGPRLIAYAREMGFTHLELLPIMEHPFGGSWGYQPLGMFAPSARYGSPAEFAAFVNDCHAAGLGLILDWVPAHFPSDPHGLAWFDGTALYEHADPRQGFHPDWNTLIYNFGRTEVRNFLMASALEWLQRFHVDGLRVDAVASMLYLDYSREPGQWTPNRYGGRENLEAVSFLQQLNGLVAERCPGAIMIAEESTAWPGVTAPVSSGGLGFHYKWNMGWMHDTLSYMARDPIHRTYHHHEMTFGMVYAYSENFILPLSHDEVVHGKGSLYGKMPGDAWQRHANLRAYLGFMWGHPGKKLLFMGGELAQAAEWNHEAPLDWSGLEPDHPDAGMRVGMQKLVRELNALYRRLPALHGGDSDPTGFAWAVGDDARNSVYAYTRWYAGQCVLVVSNMTPVPREDYRLGVPVPGRWCELLNTDAAAYGGSNVGNGGEAWTSPVPAHGHVHSLSLRIPPLATLMLVPQECLT